MTTIESKSYEDGSESESFPVIDVDVHADLVEPKLLDLFVPIPRKIVLIGD